VLAAGADGAPAARPAAGGPRDWAVERFDFGVEDRFAVLAGSSDLVLSALSTAFHAGGTFVFPEPSPAGGLAGWLQANAITVAYVNPPVLRAIAARRNQAALSKLRQLFVDNTGELISRDVDALRQAAPTCRFVGVYRTGHDGRPLATYTVPADWRLEQAPLRVPLGAELNGVPIQLRHPSGQLAAVGEVAEICYGGDRTGDLGRRWADGTLEFVERKAS
jgi:non-ribosomal peptide synthetase component F